MTLKLYDLGDVVSIVLGSMAGVLAFFQLLRTLFLDKLVKGRLDPGQQDALYHVLVWLIVSVLIVVQALMKGYEFSPVLAVSAGVAAIPIARGVNFVYTWIQKPQLAQSLGPVAPSPYPTMFAPVSPPDEPPDPAAPIVVPAESDPAAPDQAA